MLARRAIYPAVKPRRLPRCLRPASVGTWLLLKPILTNVVFYCFNANPPQQAPGRTGCQTFEGDRVDERLEARALVQQLSGFELEALLGLISGESLRDFARRTGLRGRKAADIREAMKFKLGVIQDAGAVRIGLIAGLREAGMEG